MHRNSSLRWSEVLQKMNSKRKKPSFDLSSLVFPIPSTVIFLHNFFTRPHSLSHRKRATQFGLGSKSEGREGEREKDNFSQSLLKNFLKLYVVAIIVPCRALFYYQAREKALDSPTGPIFHGSISFFFLERLR